MIFMPKKKSTLLVILLSLFTIHLFAQQKVEVLYTNIDPMNEIYYYKLYANPKNSQYQYLSIDSFIKELEIKEDKKGGLTANIPSKFSYSENYWNIDLLTSENTQVIVHGNGRTLEATDSPAKLIWEISDDTKEIGGFTTINARTSFRGRDYEVWFTPEIPISAGPWKLNGLPGLILEAKDIEEHWKWSVEKIIYPSDYKEENLKVNSNKATEVYTYMDVIKMGEKEMAKQIAIRKSRNSKEGYTTKTISTGEEYLLERKYEWEE